MSIMRKFTLAHLKKNISRTILTLIGIVVSVALMSGLLIGLNSFLDYYGRASEYSDGHYHVKMFNLEKNEIDSLKARSYIKNVGVMAGEGNGEDQLVIDGQDSVKRMVFSGDGEIIKQSVTAMYEGRLPEREGEILAEKNYIQNYNPAWKIGDTVTYKTAAGDITGKLVGIVDGNMPTNAPYVSIIRYVPYKGQNSNAVAFEFKELKRDTYKKIDSLKKEFHLSDDELIINKGILYGKLIFEKDSGTRALAIAFGIVMLIVIIASVTLIYNAFAMSLSEKVRYLGMLASVGATKAQKRGAILYEGFIMGVIGIPIGIGAGVLASFLLFRSTSELLADSGSISKMSGIFMKVVVDPRILAAVAVLGTLTVLISCIIPMLKASRITPIDAIKKQSEIKVSQKNHRSPRIIRNIFGYEGELANKNIKRNGRKSRVIILSIIVSIVVFLTVNTFMGQFKHEMKRYTDMPYQVTARTDMKNYEELKKYIKAMPGVSDVYLNKMLSYGFGKAADRYDTKDTFSGSDILVDKKSNILDNININIHYIENEEFYKMCRDAGIDPAPYHSERRDGKLNLLLLNAINHEDKRIFNENVIGKEIARRSTRGSGNGDKDYRDQIYTVKDLVSYKNSYYMNVDSRGILSGYLPIDMYKAMKDEAGVNIDRMELAIRTNDHEKLVKRLEGYKYKLDVNDMVQNMRNITSTIAMVSILMYTFIIMVTAIIIFNIINTLLTEMNMRKQEFAMLRSVGMTEGGFRSMIWFESIFYTLKALIPAIPISIFIQYMLMKTFGSSRWEIDWPIYLIVSGVVFAIISISKFCAFRNANKESIIETLKTDTI